PELIPACVALVAHPDDARYQPLFGKEVVTPLFGTRVPVRAHPLADPAKGSGVAMICTFGDITDVTWWRELSLPVRAVIQPDGTLRDVAWGTPGWESVDADRAQPAYGDWCVSRQRFFGVPFPVWYALDANGRVDYGRPMAARDDQVPVDPSTDVPPGYRPDQRGVPGGFAGDPDIMDTWATSSLSPQI